MILTHQFFGLWKKNSPTLRQASRSVENTQNFNLAEAWTHAIWHDVPGIGNDEFACAENAPDVPYGRIVGEQVYCIDYFFNDSHRRIGIILRDILRLVV
jgi:hypothetical protein